MDLPCTRMVNPDGSCIYITSNFPGNPVDTNLAYQWCRTCDGDASLTYKGAFNLLVFSSFCTACMMIILKDNPLA